MTILQKPADLNLSSNLPEFIISSAASIDFILKKGGDILLSARYVPGDDSKVIIDIKDIVESSLSCNLRDQEQAYVQDQLTATFAAEIDGTSVAFVVVKGGVDRLATSASAFLKSNWLTWQPQTKYVTYYTPEFLTFYAEDTTRVMVKAYFTSGNETNNETRELYNASAGSAYTVPVQYAVISELFGSRLPSFYDVWFASPSGTRLSYIQRYVAGGTLSETEDWIIFENSLGGLDTFRAYGETELTAEHVHNLAELGDETEEYRVDTIRSFSKSTGWLDDRQRKWLLDFFPSPQKYLYTRNFLRRIIVSEDTTSFVENVLPTGYSFTYRFADAKPLLNLSRVENLPTDLHIEVPELGSFTIPPRLVEFPSQNLSEGVLIPVQNPYAENWATTTISQIFDYTVKGIIQIGPTAFGIVIYDGLDSKATDVCLSANQGRILKETLDNIVKSIKGVALDRLVVGGKEFFLNSDGSLSTSDGILKFNGSIIATKEITAWKVGNETEEGQGGKIIIDTALSATSENPVQNKVIYAAIGDMSRLSTTAKGSLVDAINEAATKGGGGGVDASALWQLLGGATAEQINKSHLTNALKGYLTSVPQEYVTDTELQDAIKKVPTHSHANKAVLDKINEKAYASWNKVAADWDKAFYFDKQGNIRAKLNLIGEKEVVAWETSDGTSEPTPPPPGLITIIDNLSSTATNCALSANQGRVLREKIEVYLPKPLNTNPITFGHPVINTGNCLFKDDFECESSGKKWQYALFDFAVIPGRTLYARCSRQGGSGNMLRIKALGPNGENLFERNTAKNGETLEVFVTEDIAKLEVAFMLCTSEALPSGTKVLFNDAEVGYVESELDNISSILGICYNNRKIVVNTSKNVISFPDIRWHIESYVEVNKQKVYRGYSVFTHAQEIAADPRWGGFIVLDRKAKSLKYLNLPADDSTVDFGKCVVVGTIQKGQGAHFKAPFEEIGTDVSRFYESVNPIKLEMQNYHFEQKTIISRTKGDNETDAVDWDANQSIAVFKNYIFSFQENWGKPNSMAIVFDKNSHEIIGRGTIPQEHPVYNIHCNSAQFSNEFYQDGDEFPLLYLSTYVKGYLYVLRVTRDAGVFSFAIIQQITTDETSAVTYGNSFCINFAKGKLYMYYNENGNYTMTTGNDLIIDEYKLPSVADGNVTLKKADKLDSMRFPFVVFQGSTFHRGKIYLGAQGRNDFLTEGNYILVVDFAKGMIEAKIKTAGGEPEGVAIDNNKLYLSYRRTGQSDSNVRIFGVSEIIF